MLLQDSMVPPSDRCRYKTDKTPTGPFDRKHLLDYLEQKAKDDKDWEEAKPYKKETRGIVDDIFVMLYLSVFILPSG